MCSYHRLGRPFGSPVGLLGSSWDFLALLGLLLGSSWDCLGAFLGSLALLGVRLGPLGGFPGMLGTEFNMVAFC